MFNLNYPQNSLQALPFHDLDDREFHILDGSCYLQIEIGALEDVDYQGQEIKSRLAEMESKLECFDKKINVVSECCEKIKS